MQSQPPTSSHRCMFACKLQMRSYFRKGVKNILFNQKEVEEEGEVFWTESMPAITHFPWRFASCVFLTRVPMERGCHAQDERHLEPAGCMLQRSLYRAVKASKKPVPSCGGHEHSCLCYYSSVPRAPCTPHHLPQVP